MNKLKQKSRNLKDYLPMVRVLQTTNGFNVPIMGIRKDFRIEDFVRFNSAGDGGVTTDANGSGMGSAPLDGNFQSEPQCKQQENGNEKSLKRGKAPSGFEPAKWQIHVNEGDVENLCEAIVTSKPWRLLFDDRYDLALYLPLVPAATIVGVITWAIMSTPQ
jgi:hypothetical protein